MQHIGQPRDGSGPVEKLIEYRQAHYAAQSEAATYTTNTPAQAQFRFSNPILCQLVSGFKRMTVAHGASFDFGPGQVMYVPANALISVDLSAAGPNDPISCHCIEIENGRFESVVTRLNEAFNARGQGGIARPDWSAYAVLEPDQGQAIGLTHLMTIFQQNDSVFRDLQVDSEIDRAILNLLQVRHRNLLSISDDAPSDTGFSAAVRTILKDLDRHISTEDLARKAAMSVSSLHRQFLRHFGVGPARFANEQRINRARQKLRDTDASIEQIAADIGFSSGSHLGRVFRQITGETPAAFRKQRLKSPDVTVWEKRTRN
ncbi:MAG: AraC-like DNA-binding protein/uncharacterized cupin superfamily protein [Celeribacter sp.]|jgi:AraC-like DNA-binding protein